MRLVWNIMNAHRWQHLSLRIQIDLEAGDQRRIGHATFLNARARGNLVVSRHVQEA